MATSDFLYVDVLGENNLLRNLDQMPDIVRAIVLEKVKYWTNEIAEEVRDNIDARLKSKSGRLDRGVKVEITTQGLRVNGRVYMDGPPYAMIQEKGGIIPPHMIFPKSGRVLAFIGATGEKVFATKVSHPGAHILGQHYMKDAFSGKGAKIARETKLAIVKGLRARQRGQQ